MGATTLGPLPPSQRAGCLQVPDVVGANLLQSIYYEMPSSPTVVGTHMPTRHARPTRTQRPLWASARPQAEARLGGRSLDSSEGGRRLAVWRRGSRMRRPPRRDPRPSWYVRVRGGSTRGEPLTSTGSTGAAPPYTCGAEARLRSSRRSHVANPPGSLARAPAPTAALQRPLVIPVGARQPTSSEGGQELA